MATRSLIAKQIAEDKFRTIYCHWDGYLDHNGRVLLEHYNTPEKLDELLALGSISFLAPKVNPDPDRPHTFDEPQDDVTRAYARDRGDELHPAQDLTYKELTDERSWADYVYVFGEDGKWRYTQPWQEDKSLKDLEEALNPPALTEEECPDLEEVDDSPQQTM